MLILGEKTLSGSGGRGECMTPRHGQKKTIFWLILTQKNTQWVDSCNKSLDISVAAEYDYWQESCESFLDTFMEVYY